MGALVGAVVGATRLVADLALAPAPATVLALTAGVLLTGGLHEDGLADTADGMGAHAGRERRLEILRDSRIGTFGALALILWFALAVSLLAGLGGGDVLRAAVVAHALGRWSVVPQALLIAPARPGGSGAQLRPGPVGLLLSSAMAAVTALAVAGPSPGAIVLALAVVMTAALGVTVRRVFGGVTGDTFGAAVKLVELAAYAGLAAMWAG